MPSMVNIVPFGIWGSCDMARQNTVFKEAYNRCLAELVTNDNLPSEPELGERAG